MTTRLKRLRREAEAERQLARSFERRLRLSRYAIFAERLWEALLWPALVVMAFLIVSLFQLWTYLPPLAHRVLLGGFGIALLISLVSFLRLRWPTRDEAIRRLEKRAGIKHRPASSYEDTLSTTHQPGTKALWMAHRRRLAALLTRLKPSWPEPRNDRRDPYALRVGLFMLLLVALVVAGPNTGKRLLTAFNPAPSQAAATLRLDAWLTPPIYTGVAPIVLEDGTESLGTDQQSFRALEVPVRSGLTVRTHLPKGETVSLVLGDDTDSGARAVAPKSTSDGLTEFDVKLTKPGTAKVEVNNTVLASWRFKLIDDAPPTIRLTGNPTVTPRGSLRLTFTASDDYGVASARAEFALANPAGQPADDPVKGAPKPLFSPPVMNLPLDQPNATEVSGRATQDLTAHPWAGMKVKMTLVAKDQAGQEGKSQTYRFILPERNFTKPLAKAVVEQRKKLVADPEDTEPVAQAINALTIGGPKFIKDDRVYLGLRSVYWRLEDNTSRAAVKSVVDQLWDVALRIEEGDLPDAERALKTAQQRLQKALQNGASPQEIQKLVNELKNAVNKYLRAMAKQNPTQPNQGQANQSQQPQNGQQQQQSVSQQDLNKMLDNIQKLAESGSNQMAQKMLSQLNDLLQRLQTQKSFAKKGEQQRQMQQMMQQLDSLINKQQKLLDQTFAAKQKSGQNKQFEVSPPGSPMQFGMQGMSFPQLYGQPPRQGMQPGEQQQGQQGQQGQMGQMGRPQQGRSPGQQGRQGRQGQGGQSNKQLAQQQQQLMQQLQQLMKSMKGSGAQSQNQLGQAGKSMGNAKSAIGRNNLDNATQQQGMALNSMRQGAQAMAQQMQRAGSQQGQGRGGNGQRDPLGRPDKTNEPDLGLSVKVPDQINIQRAREVLDELRRRLADPNRPMIELDYLDRLIRSY